MSGIDIPRFLYLVLLLVVIGGYFLVESRRNLGRTVQMAAVWALIFLGAIAIAGLWTDIRRGALSSQAVVRDGRIEVPVSPDGHFYLDATVDGARLRFMVDTGASDVVLSRRDAERAGLDPRTLTYVGSAETANGVVRTAPVRLARFDLEGIADENVPAVVTDGDLSTSLLGMSYLSRYEMTLTSELLVLRR
ncbi:MAG: TIGR02281 family clan AA aspartic protease [Defluviimonas sp.]|uniref:retropepsin-like aspartic protease family protein n=1 Tax=Albidovulum sp. TaxID=1872424 RepID=UPI001DBC7BA6|nr:TIGR02281 family clan AA aspartic protease [Paracoccaceae bacterium]MCC0063868.1 TIGR02281 family clan AA aspartic protease [Defluviimonas sp.]